MFDTFKTIITDALQGTSAAPYASQYSTVIDKVAADIATHVSKCSEDVIAQAEAADYDTDEVRRVLVEAGLAVEREPEVEVNVEVNDTNDIDVRLTAIETTLARLSAIADRAERSGYLS